MTIDNAKLANDTPEYRALQLARLAADTKEIQAVLDSYVQIFASCLTTSEREAALAVGVKAITSCLTGQSLTSCIVTLVGLLCAYMEQVSGHAAHKAEQLLKSEQVTLELATMPTQGEA